MSSSEMKHSKIIRKYMKSDYNIIRIIINQLERGMINEILLSLSKWNQDYKSILKCMNNYNKW